MQLTVKKTEINKNVLKLYWAVYSTVVMSSDVVQCFCSQQFSRAEQAQSR